MNKITSTLSVLCLFLLAASGVSAQTINWSGTVEEPPQVFIDRKGDPLTEDFTIALGSFGSFFPTVENYQDWAMNFKVFDTATLNVDDGFFQSEVQMNSDGSSTSSSPLVNSSDTFADWEQAYIWVFDTQDTTGEFDWALITATAWLFPESGEDCCDDTFLTWTLADVGVFSVFGGVNQERGPGYYEDTTSTTFTIQTAYIPEPSVYLLLMMAGVLSLLRRRR